MAQGTIGVQLGASDAPGLLKQAEGAEQLGIPAVWAPSEPDALTVFAAAAVRTDRVLLGTAITRVAPRHPISMAQQAAVVGQLAPGRFRLGVGPAVPRQADMYGPVPPRPLAHLRAYIRTVKGLLQGEAVDIDEAGVVAHARLANPVQVPVMASALQPGAFAACGEVADGAISWLCPATYIQEIALPALDRGAAEAGREPPPLVMHVPVGLTSDVEEVRVAMQARWSHHLHVPTYLGMFEKAGLSDAREGRWTAGMANAIAVYGTEGSVADRLHALLKMGPGELIITPLGTGPDPDASSARVLRFIAELAQA